jgi:hypothetical protein
VLPNIGDGPTPLTLIGAAFLVLGSDESAN